MKLKYFFHSVQQKVVVLLAWISSLYYDMQKIIVIWNIFNHNTSDQGISTKVDTLGRQRNKQSDQN